MKGPELMSDLCMPDTYELELGWAARDASPGMADSGRHGGPSPGARRRRGVRLDLSGVPCGILYRNRTGDPIPTIDAGGFTSPAAWCWSPSAAPVSRLTSVGNRPGPVSTPAALAFRDGGSVRASRGPDGVDATSTR